MPGTRAPRRHRARAGCIADQRMIDEAQARRQRLGRKTLGHRQRAPARRTERRVGADAQRQHGRDEQDDDDHAGGGVGEARGQHPIDRRQHAAGDDAIEQMDRLGPFAGRRRQQRRQRQQHQHGGSAADRKRGRHDLGIQHPVPQRVAGKGEGAEHHRDLRPAGAAADVMVHETPLLDGILETQPQPLQQSQHDATAIEKRSPAAAWEPRREGRHTRDESVEKTTGDRIRRLRHAQRY